MFVQKVTEQCKRDEEVKMKKITRERNMKKKAEPKHVMVTSMEGTEGRCRKKGKNRNMGKCRERKQNLVLQSFYDLIWISTTSTK